MRPGASTENYLCLASLSSFPPFAYPEYGLEREEINWSKSRYVLMLPNYLQLNVDQNSSYMNSLLCS